MAKKTKKEIDFERNIAYLTSNVKKLEDSLAESHRVQKELLDREENFNLFIDTIDFLIFILDQEGNILLVNKSVPETLGYDKNELMGQSVLLVHPPDRREEAGMIVEEMLAGRRDYCPVPLICKDGSQIPAETRVVPGKWGGQDVLFGITKNLSELKASEEKFATAFDASPALIALTEVDTGRYVDVNQAFLETLGFSKEDVIGQSSRDLALFADPRERDEALRRLSEEGGLRHYAVQVRAQNGSILQGLFSAEKIRLQDKELLLTMMVDVTEQNKAEKALKEREEQLALFFEQSLDGFFFMILDEPVRWDETVDKEAALDYVFAHQRVTRVNDAMLLQYGAERDDFLGLTPNDFFAHDIRQGRQVWRQLFNRGRLHIDTEERKFDGSPMWVEGDYICLYDAEGRITGHFGVQRDVSESKEATKALRESNARRKALFDHARDAIFIVNPQTGIVCDVNSAAEAMIGRSRSELIGESYRAFQPSHPPVLGQAVFEASPFQKGVAVEGEILIADGTFIPVEVHANIIRLPQGDPVVQAIVRDITERKIAESALKIANSKLKKKLKEIEVLQQELKKQATHDALTGLYNRRYLNEMLQREFSRVKRANEPLSVMMIDADHFKDINDTYGHTFGDLFLKKIAHILKSSVRQEDIACRYGGDEFLLVMPGADIDFSQKRAEEIRSYCEALTLVNDDTHVKITLSIGVACYPYHAAEISELIDCADQALYRSKDAGRSRVCIAKKDDPALIHHAS